MEAAVDVEVTTWAQLFGVLLAIGMPYLVGLLTKASWAGKYKGMALAALAVVNGVLVEAFSPHPEGSFDLKVAVFRAIIAFVVAQGAYSAILKKTVSIKAAQTKGITDKPSPGIPPDYADSAE